MKRNRKKVNVHTIHIRVSDELKTKLEEKVGKNVSRFVRELIEKELSK